jgi:glycerol uptake facilitator protein
MLVQQLAGGTVKWQQLPVYLAAELLAGAAAALAYAFIAHTPADKQAVAPGVDLADPEEAPLTRATTA